MNYKLILLILMVSLSASCNLDRSDEKPNIIFIMADDMGYAGLSAYGCTAYHTPNIDRLAREGMKFTSAYSGCAVCAPARSTLMTGMHMGHTPVRANSGGIALPDQNITLAEVLQKGGYVCGGFGKWGLGDIGSEGAPEFQGFDEFYGYYHQVHAHSYYHEYLVNSGQKEFIPGNNGYYATDPPKQGEIPSIHADRVLVHTSTPIFERTIDFIRRNRDHPFFCYASWTLPHSRFEMPENEPAWQAMKEKPWAFQARGHAAYNLMLDRHVGELMKVLQELGIDDRTVVFFCSDNGAANRFDGMLDAAGPFREKKGSLYEGGLRIPFIAWWPDRIPAGSVSDLPIYFPDMMPTFAEIGQANKYVPSDIDGHSIVAELTGAGNQIHHDVLYWEYPLYDFRLRELSGVMLQAARSGKWKMVRNQMDQPWELYNLEEDPSESTNVASSHPEIISELEVWIESNRSEMMDQREPEYPDGARYR